MAQELVGGGVAGFAQGFAVKHAAGAHIQKEPPGGVRQMRGKLSVVHGVGLHLSGMIWLMM